MDFIERIFGVSPDGGSGVLEFLFFIIPVLALYFAYKARSMRSKGKN